MSKKFRKLRKKHFRRGTNPGAAPGAWAVDPQAHQTEIRVMAYDGQQVFEQANVRPEQVAELRTKWPVLWVDVAGLRDEQLLRQLADVFQLHPLAMEDVINVHQRPKVDHYGEYCFVVVRMIELAKRVTTDQLSLFLGSNYVLTFQERPGDCLDPVRIRLRQAQGRIRLLGPDYLAYALLDAVVDHYFPVYEELGERLEAVEEEVLAGAQPHVLGQIHRIKQDLLVLRRAAWPLRDAMHQLLAEETTLIQRETIIYLRDCYDHAVQIIDLLNTYQETVSGLTDIYLSQTSNRLNEVMRVLTVIATLFMPLSFLAAIWGMNFNPSKSPFNMPELEWFWGYPAALVLMTGVAVAQLWYFRRKGWLGAPARMPPPDDEQDADSPSGGASGQLPRTPDAG